MTLRCFIMLPMLLLSMGSLCQKKVSVYYLGPDDIILDANAIRGQFGYQWVTIPHFQDSIEDRTAQMVNVKCEFRIVSNTIDKYMNFVVHDALYTDMSMGKMTSQPMGKELPVDDPMKEGKFGVAFKWGYDFFTGYRNKHWGLMAGIRPQWSMLSIGDFSSESTAGGLSVFSFHYPLALRAEWRPFSHFEYRIIATAWSSVIGGAKWSGARVEIPTFPKSRYWIFAEYNMYDYHYLYLSTDLVRSGKTASFMAGIRFGSIF